MKNMKIADLYNSVCVAMQNEESAEAFDAYVSEIQKTLEADEQKITRLREALENLVSLENQIRTSFSFSHETSMKYLNARAALAETEPTEANPADLDDF